VSSEPLVSVVIPAHDAERYLGAAIESVLAQRPASMEILVVDDGSTDGTVDVAESFAPRVSVHSQPAAGPGAARNAGVALTRGRYIAFLDADDMWAPGKLGIQLFAFAASPGTDMVFGHLREFVSPELDPDVACRVRPRLDLLPAYLPGSLLVRRESFLRVGPLREDLAMGEFVDWMARARERGLREQLLPDHVLFRRVHDTNLTLTRRERMTDLAKVVKESLDRRRAGSETPET
jgi:glycosyltransferase involved in cell wall biosynthesis